MESFDKKTLVGKKCKVCEAGVTLPMSEKEAREALAGFKGWDLAEATRIKKEFTFPGFKEAMSFVNGVAALAEEEGHHPSIFISYNKVRITLSTFSIKGLSENDFIMAAKIDSSLGAERSHG